MAVQKELESPAMKETDQPRILLVEDEPQVSSFVCQSLEEAGYSARTASDLHHGLQEWKSFKPTIVILDLMLPDGDGLTLIERARNEGLQARVLILSAKSSMPERIEGLDAGADDYLAKPFGIQELLARIRVLLRRNRQIADSVITCGDLEIDLTAHRVTRGGRLIFLSETEYRLLNFLALNLDHAVSKSAILNHVWDDRERDENVVEVYISYLRTKLERNRSQRLIHTVRGQGYRLSESAVG